MKRDNPRLKYWVLLDGALNPVSGTNRKSTKKPKVGNWVDITSCAKKCCHYPGEVDQLLVIPTEAELVELDTQQLTVVAIYTDGSAAVVTDAATYESDDESVATVSSTGLITAESDGSAAVTVSYGGVDVEVEITVSDPELIGLRFEPVPDITDGWEVEEADTLQVTVYALYSNDTEIDVTEDATYSVDDTNTATMVDGLITGVAAGTTEVDITFETETETVDITVTA